MDIINRRIAAGATGAFLGIVLAACSGTTKAPEQQTKEKNVANPVHYFEIPVTDMDRAVRFYSAVFGFTFNCQTVDGYEMALLPRTAGATGATGALAKGDVYVPSKSGPVIYFDVPDIDSVLNRAKAQGAEILYPKKNIGEAGYVAEIQDSEGNRIALSTAADPG